MVKVSAIIFVVFILFAVAEVFILDTWFISEGGEARINAESVFDAAATSGGMNVSITVGISTPTITVIQPENITYESNESIPLEILVTNVSSSIDRLVFNVDNGANTSLTLSGGRNVSTFSTTFGQHVFYVFVNESKSGLANSSNVTFNVNDSIRFEVIFTKFNATTTNFTILNSTQLQNITNLTLERSAHGKLQFLDAINLTNDGLTNSPIGLDAYVNVSTFILVNATAFPNLIGGDVILSFYNATIEFTTPRVLRDGVACPSTICLVNWTEGQTFMVNVTSFNGKFELGETPLGAAAVIEEAVAKATPALPHRGNAPPGDEGGEEGGRPQPPSDISPTEELPFGERFREVTPKIILNKSVVVVITLLILSLLTLEYIGYRVHKDKK